MKKLYEALPEVIKSTLLLSEGWLVGSTADNILQDKPVNDYDIIVPSKELFQITCAQLKNQFPELSINTFGGLKFTGNGLELDIWAEELDHFIKTANHLGTMYNLKRNIAITKLQWS